MSTPECPDVDHNPARPPAQQRPQIGVRALLSAGAHRPQVALMVPGVGQQVRLSAEEAAELAGQLLSMAHLARYDAAVYAALGQSPMAPDVYEMIELVLSAARERITAQGRTADPERAGTDRERTADHDR